MYILALEGGVCAGKTTVANLLCENAAARSLRDYSAYLDEDEYDYASRLPLTHRVRFFLRLEDARRAQLCHVSTSPVVVDRSIFTILAYEFALREMGAIKDFTHLQENLPKFRPLIPNLVVFLDVSDQERKERARKRGTTIAEPLLISDFNDHLRQFFKKVSVQWKFPFIDTTNKTPEGVKQACIEYAHPFIVAPNVDELISFIASI